MTIRPQSPTVGQRRHQLRPLTFPVTDQAHRSPNGHGTAAGRTVRQMSLLTNLVSRGEIRREQFWHTLNRTNLVQSESGSPAIRKGILSAQLPGCARPTSSNRTSRDFGCALPRSVSLAPCTDRHRTVPLPIALRIQCQSYLEPMEHCHRSLFVGLLTSSRQSDRPLLRCG
jgi:hypothetical protein